MKTMLFSFALLLSCLTYLNAQDIYLPVSSSSEKAKAEYFKALQAIENANIPDFFDGMKAAVKTDRIPSKQEASYPHFHKNTFSKH